MADNYLESHYEEYLKKKAEWERKKRTKRLSGQRVAHEIKKPDGK